MSDDEYIQNLLCLKQKYLKAEKELGIAVSSEDYTNAIDAILDFINDRAKYRIQELREERSYINDASASYLYDKNSFNRRKLLSLIEDEEVLASTVKSKSDLGIRKIIEARNTNKDFSFDLAKIFCGDNSAFPYRSSSYITSFFKDAGFNYVHDGSTRARWVEDRIKEISARYIYTKCFPRLFKEREFRAYSKDQNKNFDDCVITAKLEIKNLLDESLNWDNTIDFSDVIGLNVKTDLLFNKKTETSDIKLNDLIDSSKDFFIQGDYQTAIEKLWDSLERTKTLLDEDKSTSVKLILERISGEIESSFFDSELKTLTNIGNNYQIRHFETTKKEIKDDRTKEYLYFRLLSLLDFILSKVS